MNAAVQTKRPSTTTAALPQHIAVIMDGNGRWAQQHGISRARGHNQGCETLRSLLDNCRARPFIRHLTLYAFSHENWKRAPEEVSDLMTLMRHYVKREAPALHENNICMRFIGELDILAPDIRHDLESVAHLTANNTALTVHMAISYGARQEIIAATRRIAQKVAAGTLQADAIDEALIAAHLHTAGVPDPDLLIRTGGEERLSNFLLWQSAYTELYFTDKLWPDFNAADLDAAIADYGTRERRFGQRNEG
ncbi:MAG: polyprenyl diphosphate synthase [Alphaproteobacteria bacterium]|nr:polyprenyl diphosphate synthase [Alphaproteobacteria bacterium]